MPKKRSKDHYLPAAVIGGFGERPPNKARRKAKVAVWVDALGRVVSTSAEKVGWQYALYDIPGDAGSAEAFEKVWQSYESDLPTAIEHLAEEAPSTRDLERLTKSRDPRFADEAGVVNLVRKDGDKRWRGRWCRMSCGGWSSR